jgi:tetratricopeptide (TPR) repeat protein
LELTLDQALQKGVEAHKAGKAQEADQYYTAILKADPKHPDANHNMGVLAVGVGKVEEALPFFKTALEVNPSIPQYWLSYIDALIRLDRVDEARAVLDQAKQHGVEQSALVQIEERLGSSSSQNSDTQDPPNDQLQSIVNLYTKGQLQEALDTGSQLLKQFPTSVLLYNIIGAANQELGNLTEAIKAYSKAISIKPDLAEAYNNMGVALKDQGKSEEANEAFTKALSIKPDYAEAYNNMGNTLQDQGKLDEATEAYNKAISIKPDYADAYNNMGNVLKDQAKLEDAIEALTKATSIKPDFSEAYNNMSLALKDQGKLDDAIEALNKALAIKPDYADAYNNMGIVFQEQDELEEAIKAYNKALAIKPDNADAYNNMGNALKEQEKLDDAIEAYNKALSIKPDYAEVYNNIRIILQGRIFNKPSRELQKTIASLLDRKTYARPSNIASAAISLLKSEPTLQKHLQLADDDVIKSPTDVISDLSEHPLLLKLMSVCPLPDLSLEKLFRKLRASLLISSSDITGSTTLINFQSALALQCFTNEYIYSHSEEEEKILQSLEANIKKTIKNNEQPAPQIILTLASYKALNQYEWCKSLVVCDKIKDVFTRQVEEPNQEAKCKCVLPLLNDISDEVSLKVRDLYEENPYPRWVNLGLSFKPMSISKIVDDIPLKLHDYKISEIEKSEILIAGCGTGQDGIQTASRFKGSKVLAIDLSLSSLSYAKRKTEELGIKNIDYMQADILDLGKLDRQFDIIESAGVLHHMDKPMAGWKVLTECLKPGGLMKVGLYSELARQYIVKIKKEISNADIGSSDEEMKSFRDSIIGSEKDHYELILFTRDFYSLSELKDLLFHVQEHRFTIPQIKDCLNELGLKFCGFESAKIVSNFTQTNKNKNDPYDLDKWQAYEEANPRAFVEMYQFWCQKIELS